MNFTCQIFFSKFRNSPSPLYPLSPAISVLSFFSLLYQNIENISRHSSLSLFVEKFAKFQRGRQTDGQKERERETTCSCSTWKCTSRLSGPNSPRYFHGTSLFLSVSLRQTLLKPREARSRRIHGGKRSNRAAFSGTRFENSVNWPFLN